MICVAGGEIIGEVQGLSYTVTREKAPLYTMGSADPRAFSRGKRGIAGSMIFLVFDRSALLGTLAYSDRARYVANEYEVPDEYRAGKTAEQPPGVIERTSGSFGVASGYNEVPASKTLARPQYHDQIMPFTVSVTAANEYGHVANMAILGIEIMNAGSGMSVDDITIDESVTFVATQIRPWSNQKFIRDRVIDVSKRANPGLAGNGAPGY